MVTRILVTFSSLLRLLVLGGLLASAGHAWGAGIPALAAGHRRELTRAAHAHWGLDAPIARFAAQVHQESGWRADARSRYADGLAQFTPATAEWIGELYPAELGEVAPFSPRWALSALVLYDRHLMRRITPVPGGAIPPCDRWAMTLSAYNGGLGWLNRDRRRAKADGADPDLWWGHVAAHTARADWAREENRGYPDNILLRWEALYRAAGWPGGEVERCDTSP